MSEIISHDLPELRARFAVQDFLVDFLGGLVPGLLFLLGLVFSVLPVILLAFAVLLGAPRITFGSFVARALDSTKQTPNTIWIAGFLILITIAYVVGHLFYRRGPKRPDQESFRRISKRFLREERGKSRREERNKSKREEREKQRGIPERLLAARAASCCRKEIQIMGQTRE